jgi:uncharacterized protein
MPVTRLLLAPGASGSIESLRAHEAGLTKRGLSVRLVELPKGRVERAVPVFSAAVEEEDAACVGGHSYGGRVASLLASKRQLAGLVLLSYPLHAPGRQETWDERTAHWPSIECPVLLLSGESDPFADLALLRQAVGRLPRGRLVTYRGVGHGVGRVLDAALDEVSRWVLTET